MVDGLPLLLQQLDQAYRAFRDDPTAENRQALNRAIQAYQTGAIPDLPCDQCGSSGARFTVRNPYNRMMDGNFCTSCVTGDTNQ